MIEKIEDGKEQGEHDRQLKELIEEVGNLQKRQPTLPDEQLKKLDDALNLANALEQARNKTPEAGRAAIQAVIQGAANSLLTLDDAGGPGIVELATKAFVNTLTQRDNLRKAAYLLARAALAVKKEPDAGKPDAPTN